MVPHLCFNRACNLRPTAGLRSSSTSGQQVGRILAAKEAGRHTALSSRVFHGGEATSSTKPRNTSDLFVKTRGSIVECSAGFDSDSLFPIQTSKDPDVKWSTGTVVENRQENASGSLRTLTISVNDEVEYLEGVRFKAPQGRQLQPRWLDAYTLPGQFVNLRFFQPEDKSGEPAPPKTVSQYPIACSPYKARQASAHLDASIIELLVEDAPMDSFSQALASLKPGSQLEVSEVCGRGYTSLFNEKVGLNSSLEEGRHLVMIGTGARGIASLHAALAWTPVLAHAGKGKVTLFYEVESTQDSAYLSEWDDWRAAGIRLVPVFRDEGLGGNLLIETLFGRNGFENAINDNPEECAILISGMTGVASAAVTKLLTNHGVQQEHVLYCDFF